jgi:hypothetical protein
VKQKSEIEKLRKRLDGNERELEKLRDILNEDNIDN